VLAVQVIGRPLGADGAPARRPRRLGESYDWERQTVECVDDLRARHAVRSVTRAATPEFDERRYRA